MLKEKLAKCKTLIANLDSWKDTLDRFSHKIGKK